MKNKKTVGIICCITAVIAVILIIVINNGQEKTPIHELALNNEEINTNVLIEFGTIEFDSYNHVDTVHVMIVNNSNQDIYFGTNYKIDYLENDTWYTIYQPEVTTMETRELNRGERSESYKVPDTVFVKDGCYRLYIENLGYCEIEFMKAT